MFKYPWQDINANANDAAAKLLRLVGTEKTVLEVGCASGYVSKVMKEQFNCAVTGIEKDPDAAKEASAYCKNVLIGDIESNDLLKQIEDEKFDVITFGDVLEHLRNPGEILTRIKHLLNDNGYIVASIPNIAHISIALELLEGRFDYRPMGLLDSSHVRFFTKESVRKLFREAGFEIIIWDRVIVKPEETEFKTALQKYPLSLLSFFGGKSEAETYQFVIKAVSADNQDDMSLHDKAESSALEEIREKVTEQELTMRELKKNYIALESKLDAMSNSWSWKITAPLRWLYGLFKKESGG